MVEQVNHTRLLQAASIDYQGPPSQPANLKLDSGKGFFNTAAWTSQTVPFFINPFRQSEIR
jgi:hypothetical protein